MSFVAIRSPLFDLLGPDGKPIADVFAGKTKEEQEQIRREFGALFEHGVRESLKRLALIDPDTHQLIAQGAFVEFVQTEQPEPEKMLETSKILALGARPICTLCRAPAEGFMAKTVCRPCAEANMIVLRPKLSSVG